MEKIENRNGFLTYKEENGNIEIEQFTGNDSGLLDILKGFAGERTIITYSSTDPEREDFGKFLVKEGFVKTNEKNSTGDKWVLEKKVEKQTKKPVKNVKKKSK